MDKNNKNLYGILQISETASPEIIKAAYETLIAKYKASKNDMFKEQSEQYITKINEAYFVLSDPIKRREYDSNLSRRASRFYTSKKVLIAGISAGSIALLCAIGFLKQSGIPKESIAENIILDPIDDLTDDDISLINNALIDDSFTAQLRENELSSYTTSSLSYDDLKYMVWISKDGEEYHTVSSCLNADEQNVPYLVSISMAESSGYFPCSECFNVEEEIFDKSNLAVNRFLQMKHLREEQKEKQEQRRQQRQEKAKE